MKIHIVTIGEPKLVYARAGWDEYQSRLKHYHQLRVTHLPDKKAYSAPAILEAAGKAYKVALEIEGQQLSSLKLAGFLEKRAQEGRETCFIVGGPEGLPKEILETADFKWSLSPLTYPHDLAMVVLAESVYRASTINSGQPYHK